MNLRALVVDDEPLARQRLRRLLQLEPHLEVLAECPDGPSAIAAIHSRRPDVVFLDVQMPHMNGFEVLAAVGPQQMPPVIFVTAHDRFAMQAFEAQALDYLLKPFGEERVHAAVARVRQFLAGGAQSALWEQLAALLSVTSAVAVGARASRSILVRKRDRTLVLQPDEIDWIEAQGDYVCLHTATGVHLLRATLADMEQRLAADGFARIHRSRLVNWDRVREFSVQGKGASEVVLKSGQRLDASDTYLKELRSRFASQR